VFQSCHCTQEFAWYNRYGVRWFKRWQQHDIAFSWNHHCMLAMIFMTVRNLTSSLLLHSLEESALSQFADLLSSCYAHSYRFCYALPFDLCTVTFINMLVTSFKGIVHFEINFWYVLAYIKGIQDVGVFVSTAFSILTFFGQTVVVCLGCPWGKLKHIKN